MPDRGGEVALVVIARAPELGRVKTRLAASLGDPRTLQVYRQLLAHVVRTAQQWPGPVLLASNGNDDAWIGSGCEAWPRQVQAGGTLGARIAAALTWGLQVSPRAIAIGTDCPAISVARLSTVVAGLDGARVAFGPAHDGGYWSIAVREPEVLPLVAADDLPWSQPTLLDVTRERLDRAAIPYALGTTLADCDDIDDFAAAVTAGHLSWPSGPKATS